MNTNRIGILSTELSDIDTVVEIFKSLEPDVSVYYMKNKSLSEIKRDLTVRKDKLVLIPDVKNMIHIDQCDYLIYLPDFSSLSSGLRNNEAPVYPVWNETNQYFEQLPIDDSLIINMNRSAFESKTHHLKEHVTEMRAITFADKILFPLFGSDYAPKVKDILKRMALNKRTSIREIKNRK